MRDEGVRRDEGGYEYSEIVATLINFIITWIQRKSLEEELYIT